MPASPPSSPPHSPRSPSYVKRKSLRLSQNWSTRDLLKDEDDTDDEEIHLAFFPLLSSTVLEAADAASAYSDQPTTTEASSSKKYDDDNSEISVGDVSIFSDVTASGVWKGVPLGESDAILGIAQAFRASTHPNKVNVCVGAYRDERGKPWVLPSVRAAERILLEQNESKEYLPIEGDRDFIRCALEFSYGSDDADFLENHIAAVQTLSGTGACRIGGLFLAQYWPKHPIYVPDPTWGNHIAIFKNAGLTVKKYRYFDYKKNTIDVTGLLHDLARAPTGSIILLHACAHNPTGCDLSIDEWKQVISVISEKEHVAFFDSAYQGFASGDAENDAQPFRYAVSQHVPVLLAQSFAKNFGLYGERCGTLSVVCGDSEQKDRILSELRLIIRPMYSSPPRHGSSIVKTILTNEKLKEQYYSECASMARRIQEMREALVQELGVCGSKHDWSHVIRQIGMFAFTGLKENMCRRLTEEYAIFLTTNGRISVAGLNPSNVQYVARAIHAVSHGESITS